jgi:hypothetical protein
VAGNVRQFDRAKRAGESIRSAAAKVAEHERLVADLDADLAQRSDATGAALHLRRLTSF